MKYKDIYTETEANPDTLSMLGPLAPLAGNWEGKSGVDTHPQAWGAETEPYHERWEFELCDPQNNGPQLFYGLRYHVFITKPDERAAFHDQLGFLLWEPETETIYMTLAIPRGQVAMAMGKAKPGDKTFTLRAERGSTVNGICSNPFLEEAFTTKSWTVTFTFNEDGTFSYDQTTILDVPNIEGDFEHRDYHTLQLVDAPRPNGAMIDAGLWNRNPGKKDPEPSED